MTPCPPTRPLQRALLVVVLTSSVAACGSGMQGDKTSLVIVAGWLILASLYLAFSASRGAVSLVVAWLAVTVVGMGLVIGDADMIPMALMLAFPVSGMMAVSAGILRQKTRSLLVRWIAVFGVGLALMVAEYVLVS